MRSLLHALVVDDEPQIIGFIADVLAAEGWAVSAASSADDAFTRMNERAWPLVFCDVVLGGPNGYDVLRRFTESQPEARFVLMTGHGSAAGALDATSIGAFEYLVKPFSIEELLFIAKVVRDQITRNRQDRSETTTEVEAYRSDLPLIGNSRKFVDCLKTVGRIAATNLPVLITGESGTGKEVVARAIHERSPRAAGPFITVNCGAIPNELIESELFGHSRGAFTGADRERTGLWEMATGGTLFLDEITETSPLFQVKLLRALQEGEIRRVGSNRTIKVDVRVLAATNRNIEIEVAEKRFRQDLMYRLNAVTIELPSLRERVEDIRPLAEYFADAVPSGVRSDSAKFSAGAMSRLEAYDWPGNIRELENAVLHAVSLSDGTIYPEHLPRQVRSYQESTEDGGPGTRPTEAPASLAEIEEDYAARILSLTAGNKQAAARILAIDRKTLDRILKRRTAREAAKG